MLIVCIFLCLSCVVADKGLAPFITPCHESDSACMVSSSQRAITVLAAGIPSLGIQVLDPMSVERVMTTQAGLEMDFRNTTVKGLRNCVVMGLKRHNMKTFLDLKCSVMLVGDYTLGGKLLILPIEGNGKYKIKIRDILVKIVLEAGVRVENGEKYWVITKWQHSAKVLTNVAFQFQNLFNGNKQLADSVHEFANSNWQDIFQEVAPPIVKAIVSKIVGETTKLFDKVPINELSLD